ncbi:MAG TPA: lactonase family protein [Pirellulales bacterium]|nr:lactonase family protein [Pirellulales bacterium]
MKPHHWTCLIATLLFPLGLATARAADEKAAGSTRVYIGTYTDGGKSEGIYLLNLDHASGELTKVGATSGVDNPSFLAIHPSRKFLYAVCEVSEVDGKKGGGVSALAIDPESGGLTLLNRQSSMGSGPCYLVVDKTGKNALVANYGGGSCCVLPIGDDGKLDEASSFMRHKGTSVDKVRQEAPHAHSINLDPANRFAFCADLGLDQVLVYHFDAVKGLLTPNDPPFASVAPGSGPRHFAFHPSGKFAYVINEMKLTVTAFAYDPRKGVLKELQTISTVPAGIKTDGFSTAEVQVHPSGKFLYGSNRGHDSIAMFSIDQATGKLTSLGQQPTGGKTPRNFGIDPSGAYLLAENQDSGTIVVFHIDPKTGKLSPAGHQIEVPMPVCAKFMTLE